MPTTPSMTTSVVGETLSTTRPPARRNAARPFAVGALGVEQDRVGGRAATAQEGGRPQRVTAVVPEPTTAHTRRPATPPVRAANSPMISVASP